MADMSHLQHYDGMLQVISQILIRQCGTYLKVFFYMFFYRKC